VNAHSFSKLSFALFYFFLKELHLFIFFSYPDLMAVAITILLTVVVALGVQCSAKFSAVFVVINLCLLLFITICGFIYGHITYWTGIPLNNQTTADAYTSFFPFGWSGTLQGAAACFWAFSGFEMISCAVEETRNPKRNIPVAMTIAITLVTVLYLGTAAGLTLLIPYTLIDSAAPLPSAFLNAGLTWGHYIVSVGPLCGFTTTLISNTYGFVRIALAMAEDGLLFKWFAAINSWTRAPVWPVVICGVLQSVIAFAFDIRDLIAFNVNLLLLSYGSVCACVIVLRYQATADEHYADSSVDECSERQQLISDDKQCDPSSPDTCGDDTVQPTDGKDSVIQHPNRLIALCRCMEPLAAGMQGKSITVSLVAMFISMLGLAVVVIYFFLPLELGVWWTIVVVTIASAGVILSFGFICIHRQTLHHAALQVG
jgi:hypothetical protein